MLLPVWVAVKPEALAKVTVFVLAPTAPLKVMAPVPPKVVLAATVTVPLAVAAVLLELIKAPVLPMPVPEMFKALATLKPFKSITAPDCAVTVPVPMAPLVLPTELTPTFRVPALSVMPPVWVLAPDKVNVPLPCLVIEPPVPLTTPAMAMSAWVLRVNALAPKLMAPSMLSAEPESVTLRPRAMFSPKVCVPVVVTDAPLICSVPPALVVTDEAVTAPPKVVVPVLFSCSAPKVLDCPTPPERPMAPAPAWTVKAALPE